jgi:hypothetical protein|uniref:PNMA-like protein 2 n=2 Tax=Castor canadensis TaxID=51338 RepID=A0A250Y394_CASCN
MAVSLLQNWCRGLDVDEHRALLVTGIPEDLEPVDIEAILQPTLLPLGQFRLLAVSAMSQEKAKAALVDFVEDVDLAAIPREIPGKDGVWRVLCETGAQDTQVLKQPKNLLLDERPSQASGDTESQAQGQGQEAGKSGIPGKAPRSRRGGRRRARGHRVTQKCKKRGRGGQSVMSESGDSSDDGLGIVIEEIHAEDLTVDEDQRSLYATLQAAAKELIKKWATQENPDEGDGPREFLALVTVTDKAKKEGLEKEPLGTESNGLNAKEDRSGVPDLVALMAVRDTEMEDLIKDDTSGSASQENGDRAKEGVDNPEFVAIVAHTEPSDPWAREEMLKIASVIESLGWGDKNQKSDTLPQVLLVMSKDTSGTRVKVEEAGRQVDAMVLRKAEEDGNLLECISALAEPDNRHKGKKTPLGLPRRLGKDGKVKGSLLELVALLAVQDMVDLVKEEEENRCPAAKCKHPKNNVEEVLAFLASQENLESSEESESDDTDSEESEPEDSASDKPRAKRARKSSKGLTQALVLTAAPISRTGRGWGVTQEKKARSRSSTKNDAGRKKKNGRSGCRANTGAVEARGQPPAGPKSSRGKKARRGPKRPPKCC